MKLQQQLKLKRTLRLAGWVACGLLLFLCGFAICPPTPVMETSATAGDAKAATNSVKLSIGDGGTLSFDLKPFSADGTFAESSEMTILASTDSYSGYTLSISAQSGDNTTKLINTDTVNCPVTETKCFIAPLPSTLNGGILKSDYVDPASSEDVNVSINTVRNTWGFSPSVYLNSGANTANRGQGVDEKYFPVSTTEMNFAKTSGPNPNDGGGSGLAPDEYKMKIGARVDTSIPMGTYKNNTFVITAVGNGASYSITYLDATGEGSGIPGVQSGTVYDTTVTLSNASPTRAGYYFGGWCSVSTTDGSCSGTPYARGASFGIDQTASSNIATLFAIWVDCPANSICYKGNGSTGGSMGIQTANYSDNTNAITSNMAVNLLPSNFKNDINNDGYNDYGFVGWSEDENAASIINATTNKPTVYGPMQNITTGNLSTSGMKLYAVWVPVAKDKDGNELTFQTTNLLTTQLTETAGDTLASKPNEYITALRDERDNQVYAVAKLKDGNYWMIENLRLESASTLGNNANNPSVTNQSLAQGYGGTPGTYGSFVGLANAESSNFSNSTTANTIYKSDSTADVYNPSTGTKENIGTTNNPGYRMPRYEHRNTASIASEPVVPNANVYSYGNYYTWAAAIADTTYYGNTNEHTTVATSICPKGWHLPYGNSGSTSPNLGNTSGGFYYLGVKLSATSGANGSKVWRSFPNNFLYSGYAYSSYVDNRGSYGRYWSSSAYTANFAYYLALYSSGLYPGTDDDNKYYGFTVRCVAGS